MTSMVRRLKSLPRAVKPVWYFPIALVLALFAMTSLKLSGTSIGIYPLLDGTRDSGHIALNPRGVRSDEWLVNTQMTVAQATDGFKTINKNIGEGQNMSLIVDAPYKEWSQLFKPQNLVFFVLPLEYAFAFKWWFLLVLLMLACYLLALELFPKKILMSALITIFVGLSPMIFWWYQSITLLPLAYSFLTIWLTLRLIKTESKKAKLGYSLALAYVLSCFALVLYPPFQIPCLIAVAVFLVAWVLEELPGKVGLKRIVSLWPYILLTVLLTGLVGGAYYVTRKDVIHTITHTVYPGTRVIPSGGVNPLLPFSSFLSPNLQYDSKAASGYLQNQSEASNFIFIAPFLFLPSLYLVVRERRKHRRLLWGLLLINALLAFFLARMLLITPWLDPLYNLFLLDTVPNTRLVLGIGFTGVLQLLLLIRALNEVKLTRKESVLLATFGGASSLLFMGLLGHYTIQHYPIFIASYAKMGVFALWIATAVFLILKKKFIIGLSLLIGFSLLSVYKIHPLYRGLQPLTSSKLISAIKSYPDTGRWIVLENRLFINFPAVAGRPSLTSVEFYPQLGLWRKLDPNNDYSQVYNRFAHVLFSTDEQYKQKMTLAYADLFVVKFDACSPFVQREAAYVLSPKELTDEQCVLLERSVDLPAQKFFIYKIVPKAN